jgi:hypothetical protein
MRSSYCLYVCASLYQLLNARINLYETWYVHIMAHEPIRTASFINTSHQFVCLYVYPPTVARQRLGKNVPAATNSRPKMEELLEALLSVRSE